MRILYISYSIIITVISIAVIIKLVLWLDILLILGVLIIPSIVVLCHKYLLKWIPYRWVIQSIIYPYNRYRLKRRLLLMNEKQVIDMWFEWQNRWFINYWFGRSLMRIVEDRRMELLERRKLFDLYKGLEVTFNKY